MKNRILALLMVMVVLVLSFASCFGPSETPSETPDETPDNNQENTNNNNNGNNNNNNQSGNMGEGGSETSSYPWENTKLIFQMTNNSNSQELPSTCARYLAGNLEDVDDVSTIDQWVKDRNDAALRETNVTVTYQYYPEGAANAWGQNIDIIDAEVNSNDKSRPDMYCNFVYDMVAVSLKGSFANLLSTSMPGTTDESAGKNYFEFADDLNLEDTGDGFMLTYMRSLTLSKFKMYCLSSDYFTDMVRAFLVVPVNIALIESLTATGEYDYETGKGDFLADRVDDFNADGSTKENYTINDFYQLVNDMEWNYENLANFSSAIFREGSEGDSEQDLRDTIGFALGTGSGLPASGMLYTTSITIINRVYDPDKGDYTYSYPKMKQVGEGSGVSFVGEGGTHDELVAFCDSLSALFDADGVIAVAPGATHGFADTDLKAIRARFATNNVLFGGVICLGSLEYDEYKEMNAAGGSGYGIVPVPLYRTNYVDELTGEVKVDNYLTQIHNIGRIGAISRKTEKFAQCSAYLNYQSTHSTDILNEYYDFKLQYDVVGTGVKGNVQMLKYIRKNVRSSFDKAFEDALGRYYVATDGDSMKRQWHTMLKDNNYQLSNMASYYDMYTPTKAAKLYNLEYSIYPTLPD